VHLRCGDYKRHCPHLTQWGAGYIGVNTHFALPDRFLLSHANSTPAEARYVLHCLPTPQQLAVHLHAARHPRNKLLSKVHILTNMWRRFVNSVRVELVADRWEV
jgi:hypothetical protein